MAEGEGEERDIVVGGMEEVRPLSLGHLLDQKYDLIHGRQKMRVAAW